MEAEAETATRQKLNIHHTTCHNAQPTREVPSKVPATQPPQYTMIEIPTSPRTTMTLLKVPFNEESKQMMTIPTKLWNLQPRHTISQQTAKKQVRFSATTDASPSSESPLLRLPENEWKTLWYSHEELQAIKMAVHRVCRQLKQYLKNNQTPSLALSEETRGLEQRCCMERQRRKFLTLRYVLKVSRHPDMSRRAGICSQWASQLASTQAQRDHASLKRQVVAMVECCSPVVASNKRMRTIR